MEIKRAKVDWQQTRFGFSQAAETNHQGGCGRTHGSPYSAGDAATPVDGEGDQIAWALPGCGIGPPVAPE